MSVMKVSVKGRNLKITPAMQEYAEKRIIKFDKLIGGVEEAFVTMQVQKDSNKIEITVPYSNGIILRAEAKDSSMYAAIDCVVEKLESQVRKQKTRLSKRVKEGSKIKELLMALPDFPEEEKEVVRIKNFSAKPMSVDEAIMQMELVGHNFFAFANEGDGVINVVYRRNDGNYGLLQPEK